MSRLKELEDENRWLKKCMLKSVLKPRLFRRLCQKSGEAISTQADGQKCCEYATNQYPPGLLDFFSQ